MKGFEFDKQFQFYDNPRIFFGNGVVSEVGQQFMDMGGQRVLVVSDPYLSTNGTLDRIIKYLQDKGIEATVFDRCEPDPATDSIIRAAELWKTAAHDAILAVGGGSSIDTAKTAGAIVAGNDIRALFKGTPPEGRIPPLIAIPTTSGTGSEVTAGAVITDTENSTKVVIRAKSLIPRIALVDPELAATMPPSLTANTGIDAFAHLLGSFLTKNYNFVSQELDLVGMGLVRTYLPRAIRDGSDMEARAGMAMAGVLGGIGVSTMGSDLAHILTSPMGGHYHLPHGIITSSVLKFGLTFTKPFALDKFSRAARALDPSLQKVDDAVAADRLIELVGRLLRDCNMPEDLTGLNIDPDQFSSIAQKTVRRVEVNKNNPRPAAEADVQTILEKAYRGEL
jgi:alcohol dehydrogenase class IV